MEAFFTHLFYNYLLNSAKIIYNTTYKGVIIHDFNLGYNP
ncbi:Hypothetical cytosolic protein [Lactobacillus helveticus H10]|nr:Hypothetical cytosolic protein [Lactobacillus helveticus H10]